MQPWFTEAIIVPAIEMDVCFQVSETFYYGPDKYSHPSDPERLVEKLTPPNISLLSPAMVRTTEALGYEPELAAYYRQIVRMAKRYNRPFNSVRHYFWLRLWLWNTQLDARISFPWYDSFAEIDSFLVALIDSKPNDSSAFFHDADQGWELEAHATDSHVYLLQRDPDAGETVATLCTPKAQLVTQARELRQRANGIVLALSSALGADVWTDYVHAEPPFKLAGS
jgi:hypothetical protein